MQKFEFLRQPLLGELAMSRKKKERERERREKNAIYSGHLRLCQQPRAVHALRSDQNINFKITRNKIARHLKSILLKPFFTPTSFCVPVLPNFQTNISQSGPNIPRLPSPKMAAHSMLFCLPSKVFSCHTLHTPQPW